MRYHLYANQLLLCALCIYETEADKGSGKIKLNVYEWGSPFEYPQCLFAGNRTNLFAGLYHSSYPSVYDAMVSAYLEPL